MIVNELQSFFIKMKLDKNLFIYQFYINLNSKHFRYFEIYFQKHDPFDKDKDTKHTFNFTMQYFQNTVCNPNSSKKSVIFIADVILNTDFISPNKLSN